MPKSNPAPSAAAPSRRPQPYAASSTDSIDDDQTIEGHGMNQDRSPSPHTATALRRKKNADAQAAFRARRANYIANLEETVTSLESVVRQLQEACREAHDDVDELREENQRLVLIAEGLREREKMWRALVESASQFSGAGLPPLPDFDTRQLQIQCPVPTQAQPSYSPVLTSEPPSFQFSHAGAEADGQLSLIQGQSSPYANGVTDGQRMYPGMMGPQPDSTFIQQQMHSHPVSPRPASAGTFTSNGSLDPPHAPYMSEYRESSAELSLTPSSFTGSSPGLSPGDTSPVPVRHSISSVTDNTGLDTSFTNMSMFSGSASEMQMAFASQPDSGRTVTGHGPPEESAMSMADRFYHSRNVHRRAYSGPDVGLDFYPGLFSGGQSSSYAGNLPSTSSPLANVDSLITMPLETPEPVVNARLPKRERSIRQTQSVSLPVEPAAPPSTSKSEGHSLQPRLSNTLAVIKAQAFGTLRKTRARSKKNGPGSGSGDHVAAAKVAMEVLAARGLDLGVDMRNHKRRRQSGETR